MVKDRANPGRRRNRRMRSIIWRSMVPRRGERRIAKRIDRELGLKRY